MIVVNVVVIPLMTVAVVITKGWGLGKVALEMEMAAWLVGVLLKPAKSTLGLTSTPG